MIILTSKTFTKITRIPKTDSVSYFRNTELCCLYQLFSFIQLDFFYKINWSDSLQILQFLKEG